MANAPYTLVLTAILATLASARLQQYCNIKTCEDPSSHVACLYDEGIYGRACGRVISAGLTEEEKQEILRYHNDLRLKVASGKETRGNPGPQPGSNSIELLEWSDELARLAQIWANQCTEKHDKCRDTDKDEVGQNRAWASIKWDGPPPADYKSHEKSLTDLMTSWSDEVSVFSNKFVKAFDVQPDGTVTAHYTQMIWGKTTKIGCGLVRYNTQLYKFEQALVCNYATKGNWIGEPVYETVGTPGRQPTSGANRPIHSPNVPQRNPNAPQRYPNVPQRIPNAPQRHPDVFQRIPNVPQRNPNAPQRHPDVFQRIPNVPQRNPNAPQRNPNAPQRIPDVFQRNPFVSQRNPNVLQRYNNVQNVPDRTVHYTFTNSFGRTQNTQCLCPCAS